MIDKAIASFRALYGFRAPRHLAELYVVSGHSTLRYLGKFWTTQNLSNIKRSPLGLGTLVLRDVAAIGMLLQFLVGVVLCYQGVALVDAARVCFGLALIVSYPLVWAHIFAVLSLFGLVLHIKPLGKRALAVLLERQVVRLREKHQFAVVAVAGSVGKTSTKLAIADALGVARRVRYQSGNYNDRLTVSLIFFDHQEPGIYNVYGWLKILWRNRQIIKQDYPYDVVVVEIAPDVPGDMKKFAYLQPEIGVLTAVAPEHMEIFGTLDGVAAEETAIFEYCQKVVVNSDDIATKYLAGKEYVSYGSADATYALKATNSEKQFGTQRVTFDLAGRKVSETIHMTGVQGAKIALAAVAVASELALSEDDVKNALKQLHPFAGRMQILPGIKGSTLIDDTYNASPAAVKAALDVLYVTDAPQRIALLGNMNEMGDFSEEAHTEIGNYCDPAKLDLVLTLGPDANNYLAKTAKERGCNVKICDSPYEAGELIKTELKKGALVLIKGSQNRVFAEEAVKALLQNKDDEAKLVRQSDYWMKIKAKQFTA